MGNPQPIFPASREIKLCTKCGAELMTDYSKEICKKCTKIQRNREWYSLNPLKVKEYKLKVKYGITLDEYNKMLERQQGQCLICGSFDTLCVDHDHTTGEIRGLLCPNCNHLIGFAKDNIEILQQTIEYLRG